MSVTPNKGIGPGGDVRSNLRPRKRKGPHTIRLQQIEIAKSNLEWNETNQPVGNGAAVLSSYIGVIVKGHFPPSPLDWRELSEQEKETVWDIIKGVWDLDDTRKSWVMLTMAKIWRGWKSKLSTKMSEFEGNPDATELRARLRPEQVSEEDWEAFVADRQTPEFREKSESNRQRARKNIYTTALGRKSLATKTAELKKERTARGEELPTTTGVWIDFRLRRNKKNRMASPEPTNPQVKDFIERSVEASQSKDVVSDPLTIVLGPEHPGRVQGMGLGTTPSSMNIFIHSKKNFQELQKENKELRERQERFEAEIRECQQKMEAQMHAFMEQMRGGKSQGVHIHPLNGSTSSSRTKSSTFKSIVPPGVHEELHGRMCNLFDPDCGDHFVVAETMLIQTDPGESCHNSKIGKWCCAVKVLTVYQDDVELPYPNADAELLGEARLTIIKWPRRYIELFPSDPSV